MKVNFYVSLLLAATLIIACSDDKVIDDNIENEPAQEELFEMAQVSKFNAMNSVIRALAGLDCLPDNWETAAYIPTEGVVTDETNPDVRSVITESADGAEQYFQSILPGGEATATTWTHEGVGTLTFNRVNSAECYGTIDVALTQMPGLKQIRLVPEGIIGVNSKFSGVPYYSMGDIVQDTKTKIYWICVRPSGGPLKKDQAYFVSFDKSLIKIKEVDQTIYMYNEDGKTGKITKTKDIVTTSGKWKYATNLPEKRVAIAAGHTFCALTSDMARNLEGFKHCNELYEAIKYAGILDLKELRGMPGAEGRKNEKFIIPYGSYASNANTKDEQYKYLQTVLKVTLGKEKDNNNVIKEEILTNYMDFKLFVKPGKVTKFRKNLYSLTSNYDPLSYLALSFNAFGYSEWNGKAPNFGTLKVDYNTSLIGYNVPYNILDYTIDFEPGRLNNDDTKVFQTGSTGWDNSLPLVMTQLKITDKGIKNSRYVKLCTIDGGMPDYWKTLDYTRRYILDDKYDSRTAIPVKNIYE